MKKIVAVAVITFLLVGAAFHAGMFYQQRKCYRAFWTDFDQFDDDTAWINHAFHVCT